MNIIARILRQAGKPSGRFGRWMTRFMNAEHSRMTDWALSHISVAESARALDVGCGGGRTIRKLAGLAVRGKITGLDFSETSVAAARQANRAHIAAGRVEVIHGSVSHLPFADGFFDLVSAVETYYFWPDLASDIREVFRVVKSGGQFALAAESYKGGAHDRRFRQILSVATEEVKINYLSAPELGQALTQAGFQEVEVFTEEKKGWVCALGRKR